MCAGRIDGRPCSGDLTTPGRRASSADIDVQRTWLDAVTGRSQIIAGLEEPALVWLRTLKRLVGLVRRAEHFGQPPSTRSYLRRPGTPEEALHLLRSCVPSLASGRRPDALRPLASSPEFPRLLERSGLPPHLVAEWCPSQRRTVGTVRRTRAAHGGFVFAPGVLPQAVPLAVYDELSHHLPGTRQLTGRIFGALAVARVAGARDWSSAGRELALPPLRVSNLVNAVRPRLVDDKAFWERVHQAAKVLEREGVDYGRRRRAIVDNPQPATAAWSQTSPRSYVSLVGPAARSAALWLWEFYACADLYESPLLVSTRDVQRDSVLEHYRLFRHRLTPSNAAALRTWADQLTAAIP